MYLNEFEGPRVRVRPPVNRASKVEKYKRVRNVRGWGLFNQV